MSRFFRDTALISELAFALPLLVLIVCAGCRDVTRPCTPAGFEAVEITSYRALVHLTDTSRIHTRELILALYSCDVGMSTFCAHGVDLDGPIIDFSHFPSSSVPLYFVAFDTTCWDIIDSHGEYFEMGPVLIDSVVERDSLQQLMLAGDMEFSEMTVWPWSNDVETDDLYYNLIRIRDKQFRGFDRFFDHFLFRLYKVRLSYVSAGVQIRRRWNIGRHFPDCGMLVDVPATVNYVIGVEYWEPFQLSKEPCVKFR